MELIEQLCSVKRHNQKEPLNFVVEYLGEQPPTILLVWKQKAESFGEKYSVPFFSHRTQSVVKQIKSNPFGMAVWRAQWISKNVVLLVYH